MTVKLTPETILQHSVVECVFKRGDEVRRDLYLIIPTPSWLDIRMTGAYWAPKQKIICASVRLEFRDGRLWLHVEDINKYIEGIWEKGGSLTMSSDNFSHYEAVDWGRLLNDDESLKESVAELQKIDADRILKQQQVRELKTLHANFLSNVKGNKMEGIVDEK